jgi:hypothetical protein
VEAGLVEAGLVEAGLVEAGLAEAGLAVSEVACAGSGDRTAVPTERTEMTPSVTTCRIVVSRLIVFKTTLAGHGSGARGAASCRAR